MRKTKLNCIVRLKIHINEDCAGCIFSVPLQRN